MKYDYRIFGIHIVIHPKDIKIEQVKGQKRDPALTPIDQVINDKQIEGWEYVSIIPGFHLALPSGNNLTLPGGPQQPLMLPGACVLMRKERK